MVEDTAPQADVQSELGKSEIEKRADELSLGKTGEAAANEGVSKSPIEEARGLHESLIDDLKQIRQAKKELDDTLSALMLSGKSMSSTPLKEPTQDELDDIKAKELIGSYR